MHLVYTSYQESVYNNKFTVLCPNTTLTPFKSSLFPWVDNNALRFQDGVAMGEKLIARATCERWPHNMEITIIQQHVTRNLFHNFRASYRYLNQCKDTIQMVNLQFHLLNLCNFCVYCYDKRL